MVRSISTGIAIALLAAVSAHAQTWPVRPVTMVVPFAAGGGNDVIARILTPRMSEVLGQQVVIENIGGAGGVTGAARVAKAAPDGYMFVIGNSGTHAQSQTMHRKPPYNAITDFAPVALIGEQPLVLIARPDLPATSLQEFSRHTKANQTKMQYASAGLGSATHLACAMINVAIGADVVHVPFRSGPAATQELIAGRIDYQCPQSAPVVSLINAKQVKAIAMLSRERALALKDLPTAHEQGLANFDAVNWSGLFLPRDTSPAIVRRLHEAAVAAMNTPAVEQRLRDVGVDLVPPERRSTDYLAKFVASEVDRWAVPIKAAGIRID
jgi:tripartite-type tricarboxylate transporter receptor subunit TctC